VIARCSTHGRRAWPNTALVGTAALLERCRVASVGAVAADSIVPATSVGSSSRLSSPLSPSSLVASSGRRTRVAVAAVLLAATYFSFTVQGGWYLIYHPTLASESRSFLTQAVEIQP
jgi:hypothetical protein